MSSDGLSLARRFKMALDDISKLFNLARGETETNSNAWILEYWQETPDSVDTPDSIADQVRFESYDWLPVSFQFNVEELPSLSQCLHDIELGLLKFDKALQLVCKDEDGGDDPKSMKNTFEQASSTLGNILSELTIVRDQLGQNPPDATDAITSVETSFEEKKPDLRNDRYIWEYVIIKQLMEYLSSCGKLFKQLAEKHDEQSADGQHDEL